MCAAAAPKWICIEKVTNPTVLCWTTSDWNQSPDVVSHFKRILLYNSPYELCCRLEPPVTVGYQELSYPVLSSDTHTHTPSDMAPHQPVRCLTFDPQIQLYYIILYYLSAVWVIWADKLIDWLLTHWWSVSPAALSLLTPWSASQDERVKIDSGGTVLYVWMCVYCMRVRVCVCVWRTGAVSLSGLTFCDPLFFLYWGLLQMHGALYHIIFPLCSSL